VPDGKAHKMQVTTPLQYRVAKQWKHCAASQWQTIARRWCQFLGVPTWRAAEQAHGAAQLAEAPLPDEHGVRLLVLHHLTCTKA
jgi:hypothetical protein